MNLVCSQEEKSGWVLNLFAIVSSTTSQLIYLSNIPILCEGEPVDVVDVTGLVITSIFQSEPKVHAPVEPAGRCGHRVFLAATLAHTH